VLLDADVAAIYGVATKEVNQAVANNPEKFPEGYILELTPEEKQEVVKNFDHLQKLKFSTLLASKFSVAFSPLKGSSGVSPAGLCCSMSGESPDLHNGTRNSTNFREEPNFLNSAPQIQTTCAEGLRGGACKMQPEGRDAREQASQTTVELNVAFLKLKHAIKRKKDEK